MKAFIERIKGFAGYFKLILKVLGVVREGVKEAEEETTEPGQGPAKKQYVLKIIDGLLESFFSELISDEWRARIIKFAEFVIDATVALMNALRWKKEKSEV